MPRITAVALAMILVLGAAGVLIYLASEALFPASGMTQIRLRSLQAAVEVYHARHGVWPADLAAVGRAEKDGWEHPFEYTLGPDGSATVVSLGRDGRAGGTGEDADLLVTCTAAPGPATTRAVSGSSTRP